MTKGPYFSRWVPILQISQLFLEHFSSGLLHPHELDKVFQLSNFHDGPKKIGHSPEESKSQKNVPVASLFLQYPVMSKKTAFANPVGTGRQCQSAFFFFGYCLFKSDKTALWVHNQPWSSHHSSCLPSTWFNPAAAC
jgi:hypothetical protein